MRNIVGASAKHGVIAVAHYPQIGDSVGLVLRNAERARDDLKATLEEMRDRIGATLRPSVYISIACRAAPVCTISRATTRPISSNVLERSPIAGFFTGFEIGPMADFTGLLQYSGVLVLVSEKKIISA